MVGGALGSMVAPGIGTAVGSKLGSMASGMFEVELEAMPAEAAEFEAARRFVRTAASSAHHAAMARPRPGVSPRTVARAAVAAGARHNAPGVTRVLIQTLVPTAPGRRPMGRRAARGGGAGRRWRAGPSVAARRAGPRRGRWRAGRAIAPAGRPGLSSRAAGRAIAARRAGPRRGRWRAGRAIVSRRAGQAIAVAPVRAGGELGRPARRHPTRRGPRLCLGYPGAPAGQRRRPARGVPAGRGRRGYGGGYGGWYGPPRTGPTTATTTTGAPVAANAATAPRAGAPGGFVSGNGHHASGRWVRRGRQIVLYGV